ncbi:dehydrogenase/reductase sdr family protein 7-like [Plakobranchus ocellatus]|uniref:Dehydrogenase/reductase sdr family protein 7-like n=1 Tax=Plakobranchus ocellatus TaxID=259542 RepID=A0AAV4DC77_9GAST|nr:dehydrogenase/reductase sdr family protein 7-like [Plakobranchus ocellatus]
MGDLGVNALWAVIGLPVSLISLLYFALSRRKNVVLQDKVVFITGASSGLGEACAEAFHFCGCKVILAGRNEHKLVELKNRLDSKKLCHQHSPVVCVLDLEDDCIDDKVRLAIASIWGRIDILINNAGMSYRGAVSETKSDVDMKLMVVNHLGHIKITKAILPFMVEQKSGHIVCISSVQGRMAIPHRSAYAASKHAMQAYFDSLRAEVEHYGINVCVVSPYYIRTNLSLNALSADGSTHGKHDQTTLNGYDPHFVAQKIVNCVQRRCDELILAPFYVKLAICLRVLAPWLYFKIMARRAKKELSANDKHK